MTKCCNWLQFEGEFVTQGGLRKKLTGSCMMKPFFLNSILRHLGLKVSGYKLTPTQKGV